jgi:hypothetical protein
VRTKVWNEGGNEGGEKKWGMKLGNEGGKWNVDWHHVKFRSNDLKTNCLIAIFILGVKTNCRIDGRIPHPQTSNVDYKWWPVKTLQPI